MKNTDHMRDNRSGRVWSGLILLIIGLVFLLRNLGVTLPYWLFKWNTLLILIGVITGFRRRFHGAGWLIMILVGGYFTVQDIVGFNFSQYYFAVAFIALGLFMMLRPPSKHREEWRKKFADFNFPQAGNEQFSGTEKKTDDDSDYIDSVNVFSGSKQQIFSKNFKGGDVISVFGGCELDLTQADFQETVTLDVVAVFGGIKIAVPPSWHVKTEITPFFGGVDDSRSIALGTVDPQRIIRIKGVALFGGLSITNF